MRFGLRVTSRGLRVTGSMVRISGIAECNVVSYVGKEVRGQKSDGRRQKTDDRRQMAETMTGVSVWSDFHRPTRNSQPLTRNP
jgi:hypothetical protein